MPHGVCKAKQVGKVAVNVKKGKGRNGRVATGKQEAKGKDLKAPKSAMKCKTPEKESVLQEDELAVSQQRNCRSRERNNSEQRMKTSVEFQEDEERVVMEAEGDVSFLESSESGEETQDLQSSNNNATCTPVSKAFESDQESGDLSGDSEISLREEGLPPLPKKAMTKRRGEGSKGANSSMNENEKEEIINEMMRFQEQFATKGQPPPAQVASTQRSPRNAGMNQLGTSAQRDQTAEVSWGDNSE